MDARAKSLLVQLLIAKSIVEGLLVVGLTVGFVFDVLPPSFEGWGEAASHAIEGWAINKHHQSQRVEVQLFIDDQFFATMIADRSRPDVAAAGYAVDDRHGYSFQISSLSQGSHTARVYAVHSSGGGARKTLQLVGDPIPFAVDAEGVLRSIPQPFRAR